MWEYQALFRVGLEGVAERVFKLLDESFKPEIFLVGILVDNLNNGDPVCVEAKEDFWIQSEAFNPTLQIASEICQNYPEKDRLFSDRNSLESHNKLLFLRSIRDAIIKIIDSQNNTPNLDSYFVSLPTKVEKYHVCSVLKLQKNIVDSYPALATSQVAIHKLLNAPVTISLIDATITKMLEKACGELNLPEPGKGLLYGLSTDQIVREAANEFVRGLAFRADSSCISGLHILFSACNNIASAFYEKAEGKGTFILARKMHPAIETIVEFSHPAKLEITRGARKLLELASQDFAIHTDAENIYGLVKYDNENLHEENVFVINILDHHHWEVLHADKVLMRVKYGQPYLPKPLFNKDKLRNDLPRIFNEITPKQINRIVDLVEQAGQEEHGTMLLIAQNAEEEALRLSNQSIPITPKDLTPSILKNLTSIDGAIILDPNGTCFAIGAILDGLASEDGDPSRGARYNSALRYTYTSKSPCLAIVVSEDGGVNLIPDLPPAIKKTEIDANINTLKEIAKSELIYQSFQRKYHDTMQWLTEHRLYFSEKDCQLVNELMDNIIKKTKCEEAERLQLRYGHFSEHPKFDPRIYYLDN